MVGCDLFAAHCAVIIHCRNLFLPKVNTCCRGNGSGERFQKRDCCAFTDSGGSLCRTLYDVFKNIADDEKEHVKTMTACRDYSIVSDLINRDKAATHRTDASQNGSKVEPPKDEAQIPVMDTSRLK